MGKSTFKENFYTVIAVVLFIGVITGVYKLFGEDVFVRIVIGLIISKIAVLGVIVYYLKYHSIFRR